jgi:cold shock CspA family protein
MAVGKIKWFDGAKGYGFIASSPKREPFTLTPALFEQLQTSSAKDIVRILDISKEDLAGFRAVHVLSPEEDECLSMLESEAMPRDLLDSRLEQNIFVHHTAILAEGFRALREGQEVEFDIKEGPRGLQAANVRKVGSQD